MKTRMLFIIFIIICASLVMVSCSSETDGFAQITAEYLEKAQIENAAVLNLSSKTIHMDGACVYLKNADSKNKFVVEREMTSYYTEKGYKYCKRCSSEYAE